MQSELLYVYRKKIEEMHPLVHCITNTITIWDCANILLAAGASPTMAHHPEETAEITLGCASLVCNLGATENFDAMLTAAAAAGKAGHPVIVDPVGCGGSSFRRKFFKKLAESTKISCIRGNASEIRALALEEQTVTGVDAGLEEFSGSRDENTEIPAERFAKELASRLSCIVIASGATDVVTDGKQVFYVKEGNPMMSKITGSGCMSSALLGAYLAVENSIQSAAACCTTMGLCGERAAERAKSDGKGTMTFHTNLIDEMSLFGQNEN